jgi:hypothetical protein
VAVCPAFQFREADGSVSLLVSVAVVPLLLSPTLASRRLNCLQNKTKKCELSTGISVSDPDPHGSHNFEILELASVTMTQTKRVFYPHPGTQLWKNSFGTYYLPKVIFSLFFKKKRLTKVRAE